MQFLKAFGLFLLLIWGSTGQAFATSPVEDETEEHLIAPQIAEDCRELPFSTLINPSSDSERYTYEGGNPYIFQSLHRAGEAKRYLLFSRFIDPGLGVSEIIFPFHTYL